MLFSLQEDFGEKLFNHWDGEHIEADSPQEAVKTYSGDKPRTLMVGYIDTNWNTKAEEVIKIFGPYRVLDEDVDTHIQIETVYVDKEQ